VTQAHASGDAQALWDHVHKLHGATVYCGVPALREAAKGVEDAIRQNATDLDPRLLALEQAIRDLLAEGPAILAREW
jgi:two-component system sensor histidine kinase BarA